MWADKLLSKAKAEKKPFVKTVCKCGGTMFARYTGPRAARVWCDDCNFRLMA